MSQWERANYTDATCPQCGNTRRVQVRSAREGKVCASCAARNRQQQRGAYYLTCQTCGKQFNRAPAEQARCARVKGPIGTFCSMRCAGKTRVTCTCEVCGTQFSAVPVRLREGNVRFCSYRCAGIGHSGPNHPNWRNGASYEPYPLTFNPEFKRMIRERDRYRCARCGQAGSKDVHHIDAVKANTIPENCITLCKSCHSTAQNCRVNWKQLYQEVLCLRSWATAIA